MDHSPEHKTRTMRLRKYITVQLERSPPLKQLSPALTMWKKKLDPKEKVRSESGEEVSDYFSMVKKTVLKVNINCPKCKRKLLKTVSSIQGVDKVEVDGGKGTLTVTGDADPYEIIVRIRKAGKHAEVVSIGPPPEKEAQKKAEDKKDQKRPEPYMQMPRYYPPCQPVAVVYTNRWEEPYPSCTIL
ncbi:DEAD-box ATP-dependent RNA helicase 40 [Spatholobus suberectus]|nr:DEAD-box ATP-dependent RNA helicase 40 [Spatholobus suberectus]